MGKGLQSDWTIKGLAHCSNKHYGNSLLPKGYMYVTHVDAGTTMATLRKSLCHVFGYFKGPRWNQEPSFTAPATQQPA